MVHNQVLLGVDTYDTDTIAMNKLCKLNFSYLSCTLYVSSRVIRACFSLNMVLLDFSLLILSLKN